MPVGISFPAHEGYGAGTVDGIATNGWKVRDGILTGTRFIAPVHTGPGTHSGFCTVGTGSFPGANAAGERS